MKNILYWSPRIFAIIYILFLALFALDVFIPGRSIPEMIGGFLIHLIPNYFLIIFLWIAWKKEKLGGILFILITISFGFIFRNPLPTNLILLAPPIIIGILFLLSSNYKK